MPPVVAYRLKEAQATSTTQARHGPADSQHAAGTAMDTSFHESIAPLHSDGTEDLLELDSYVVSELPTESDKDREAVLAAEEQRKLHEAKQSAALGTLAEELKTLGANDVSLKVTKSSVGVCAWLTEAVQRAVYTERNARVQCDDKFLALTGGWALQSAGVGQWTVTSHKPAVVCGEAVRYLCPVCAPGNALGRDWATWPSQSGVLTSSSSGAAHSTLGALQAGATTQVRSVRWQDTDRARGRGAPGDHPEACGDRHTRSAACGRPGTTAELSWPRPKRHIQNHSCVLILDMASTDRDAQALMELVLMRLRFKEAFVHKVPQLISSQPK